MYNLYGIYNQLNGNLYIGITNNLKRRWYEHQKAARKLTKDSYAIHRALHKYGISNFIFKCIEQLCDLDSANLREIEWIKILRDNGYSLYNITKGGDGTKGNSHQWTKERKQEASKKYAGSGNPMYGVKLLGKANGNYGKTMKQHVKNKLLKSRRKLNSYQIKKIIKLFNSGKYTQTQLSKDFNVSLTQIHRIVRGKSWGNKNHDAILTKKNLTIEDVKKIKDMYKTKKYTQKYIAKVFGITSNHVYKILSGKKWSNIK